MDPLAQLKDIHLPEQVHNYPLAPGWWLVFFISLILIVFLVRKLIHYRKIRIVKKQIIRALSASTSIEQSSELLKLALLNYFPRQQTANLYGSALSAFLIKQLPTKKQESFKKLTSFELDAIYQEKNDIALGDFNQSINYWLNNALPPKEGRKHD